MIAVRCLRQLSSIVDALCAAGGGEHKWLVNQQNFDGRTALHVVAARGQLSAVKTLLDRGAATDLQDNDDNAPLHTALLAADTTHTADIVAAICASEQARADKSFVRQHGSQRYIRYELHDAYNYDTTAVRLQFDRATTIRRLRYDRIAA